MSNDEKQEVERLSLADSIESLTGYEELKIEEHFKSPFGSLNSLAKMKRSLIFIHRLRAGDKDSAAYKVAMEMRLVDVNETFLSEEEDEDDPLPDEPVTEQGKDDSPSD